MNGSRSPDPVATDTGDSGRDEIGEARTNGHRSPSRNGDIAEHRAKSSPVRPPKAGDQRSPPVRHVRTRSASAAAANGGQDELDSEAETLIDSPVKKKEAEKQKNAIKSERPPKHRIGSLPVPIEGDEENESIVPSPVPSTIISVEKTASMEDVKNEDNVSDDGSGSLSSPRSSASNPPSPTSSRSRAASEVLDSSRNVRHSPNPRKRKHRASSVSLPNKRPSLDLPKRTRRGIHSEDTAGRSEQSLSPKIRNHRRAASTQAAFIESGNETGNRKRRAATQGLGKDSAGTRAWEESDGSSEATSHGQPEHRRLPRGVGRSTSIPGRPAGREHKRHVNKYGFTRLAEACELGDLNAVREWRHKDAEQLELAEFAGNKPLQIAALNGNVEVVDYLIEQGCKIDCANVDKDTPLIDAAENGHVEVVHSLLRAGVDPLRQNLKGQQALDVVTDDTDNADDIRAALRNAIEEWINNGSRQRREEEEELRHRAGPTKELHFMARTYENLLKLVQINDRSGVKEFLDARVPVDNAIIGAAAKTGDVYLLNMLLADLPEKKAKQKPEKPMLSVLGTSHLEMVKFLSKLPHFDPLYRNRQGKSWPELAEERAGPNRRDEKDLLQTLYDQREQNPVKPDRRSSSPVSKRESGKRRYTHRAPDDGESDEDEAPRRTNGRRLMSKRDMRAASGKAASDESSDESSSEMETPADEGDENDMKPPESPIKRSTPSRTRRKSSSAQPSDTSPKLRRRSLSVRESAEQPLPTVEESAEDREAAQKREEEEEEKRIAEEAEAQERAAAEAAAKLEAEEVARKVEEQRRQEEERRVAEAERLEEEQRRIEEEAAAAAVKHRLQVLASLPNSVSRALSPMAFDHNSADAPDYLITYFTPLQILKHEHPDPYGGLPIGPDTPFWVANIQAAGLLGEQGVQLLLSSDVPGWDTKEVKTTDRTLIESVLTSVPQYLSEQRQLRLDTYEDMTCEEESQRIRKSVDATNNLKTRLREGEAVLRFVRLDDVLKNLPPSLKTVPIDVRFDYLQPTRRSFNRRDSGSFFTNLADAASTRPRPRRYLNGVAIDCDDRPVMGTTSVAIMHQK